LHQPSKACSQLSRPSGETSTITTQSKLIATSTTMSRSAGNPSWARAALWAAKSRMCFKVPRKRGRAKSMKILLASNSGFRFIIRKKAILKTSQLDITRCTFKAVRKKLSFCRPTLREFLSKSCHLVSLCSNSKINHAWIKDSLITFISPRTTFPKHPKSTTTLPGISTSP